MQTPDATKLSYIPIALKVVAGVCALTALATGILSILASHGVPLPTAPFPIAAGVSILGGAVALALAVIKKEKEERNLFMRQAIALIALTAILGGSFSLLGHYHVLSLSQVGTSYVMTGAAIAGLIALVVHVKQEWKEKKKEEKSPSSPVVQPQLPHPSEARVQSSPHQGKLDVPFLLPPAPKPKPHAAELPPPPAKQPPPKEPESPPAVHVVPSGASSVGTAADNLQVQPAHDVSQDPNSHTRLTVGDPITFTLHPTSVPQQQDEEVTL